MNSLFPDADLPPARPVSPRTPPVIPVGRLVASARLVLERHLGSVWVAGELSNVSRAASGHCYFTLKDADAQVRCVMWRSKAQLLDFGLRDGLAVEVRAVPSLYEPKGEFQLNVDAVRLAGAGALYERFLRLKAKLEGLGWFEPARKRSLPRFPRRVGVVTSPRGAALSDVITTLHRRWPALQVIVYPCIVQGDGAAHDVARAIATANRRGEVDVLIVCRGGGSLEDLWAFNEEVVARAVFDSSLPIVSGVGHETDSTICDFVADARAPTPTGAAQLVAPDSVDYRHRARQLARRFTRAALHAIEARAQRIDIASRRLVHPSARLLRQRERLVQCARQLRRCWSHHASRREARLERVGSRLIREITVPAGASRRVEESQRRLARAERDFLASATRRLASLAQSLAHLNPQAVLERGYAIVATPDGEIVVDSATLKAGDEVTLTLARGSADATIRRRR
ncbi:MAG TPA: exodeoxyribonuclease VII large subunit [Casimicrobiaceae bacterium]|nr:exodeoxyribonuclease VII large subunit [Casimicrobiaceae bacterium]